MLIHLILVKLFVGITTVSCFVKSTFFYLVRRGREGVRVL